MQITTRVYKDSSKPAKEEIDFTTIIKNKERRNLLTNHPAILFQCNCLHDEAYHIEDECTLCDCKQYIQKNLKILKYDMTEIVSRARNIRTSKDKTFWKNVESNLITKGDSPIL